MRYTSVTEVRQKSGFQGNSNITDAYIAGLITEVQGLIDSKISDAYAMPLPRFYKQQIVFSGAGTGAGTMTLTIDGVNYAITIANALTAAQAADLFRTATVNSDDFVTDGNGDGATVTIWSKDTDDPTGVTISSTDPQTVQGITATGGTVTTVPAPYIGFLATELVVARLLIIEYGEEAQDTDKDGFKRLAIWESELKKISEKKKKILDFGGTELPKASRGRLSFKPNNTTEVDADNPTDSRFTMNKIY